MSSTILWINTVVSLIGVGLGSFLAIGSVISIANMQVSWAGVLLIMAVGVPIAFAISGIGAWWAYSVSAVQFVTYLMVFPWVYLGVFVGAMLVSFKLIR
jgi:hypothetical protein